VDWLDKQQYHLRAGHCTNLQRHRGWRRGVHTFTQQVQRQLCHCCPSCVWLRRRVLLLLLLLLLPL
jgi:hypothetical protein